MVYLYTVQIINTHKENYESYLTPTMVQKNLHDSIIKPIFLFMSPFIFNFGTRKTNFISMQKITTKQHDKARALGSQQLTSFNIQTFHFFIFCFKF